MSALAKLFGQHVQRERQRRGWSQERLAEAADLERAYLAHLERGRRNPTLGTVERIAAALDVDIRTLLAPGGDHQQST